MRLRPHASGATKKEYPETGYSFFLHMFLTVGFPGIGHPNMVPSSA